MTPDQHRRLGEIVFAAAELSGPRQRQYLDEACAGDALLREAAEQVLEQNDDEKTVPMRLSAEAAGAILRDDALQPERIGPYRILCKIGEGGMGAVYEAEQDSPRRSVAIKMLRPGYGSAAMVRRFKREIELLGRLQHPGIAQVYGAGSAPTPAGEVPYFAMELVRGLPLNQYAEKHALTIDDRLRLVASICDAVQFAHQHGVIHRDLKPANILVEDEGTKAHGHEGTKGTQRDAASFVRASVPSCLRASPKILDFGIARAMNANEQQVTTLQTEVGQIIGTLPYMSPEQVAGRSGDVDTRTDIYALGVILYQLLSGRLPHDVQDRTLPEAARIISQDPPTRLGSIHASLRGDVETIVNKALEHDKERRYASASELAADIRRYLNNEPISARPATMLYQLRKFAKRNRGLVIGSTAAVAFLVIGFVTTAVAMLQARRNADLARANEISARRASYRLSIAAAAAVSSANPVQARKHLDDAPQELRNWEWRYELARLEPFTTVVAAESPVPIGPMVAFQPNGTPLAALVRDGGVEITDLSTAAPAIVIRSSAPLAAPALSPDGARLAGWRRPDQDSPMNAVEVWDVRTGQLVKSLTLSNDVDVRRLAFNRDGVFLAASSSAGIFVWQVEPGQLRLSPGPEFAHTEHAAFSHDGSRVFVSHRDPRKQSFLSARALSGALLHSRGIREDCNALACSPDGTRIAVGSYNRVVHFFDAQTLDESGVLRGHASAVTAIAYSADGTRMATSSRDGTSRVWDVATGQTLASAATGEMHAIAFSPDGSTLAAAGPRAAVCWEWGGTNDRLLTGHSSYVYFTAFSPDGRTVASYGWDDQIRLWDAFTGEQLASREERERVMGLDFTADGSRLVVAHGTTVVLVDGTSLEPVTTAETPADHERFKILSEPSRVDVHQVYRQYLRIAGGGAKNTLEPEGGQRAASSLDGTRMAAGQPDGTVTVLDAGSGRIVARVKAHSTKPRAVALGPDGKLLATSGEDGLIELWNAETAAPVAMLRGHVSKVYSIAFSPDGSRIVSGGNDNTILLWDAHSFEQVAALHGHSSYVHSVSFSPDGTQIVSGSGDGTVRVWDAVPRAQRKLRRPTK